MDAPAPAPAQGGGGVAEALVSLDAQLAKIVKVVTSAEQIPDEVKGDFANAQSAFRSGLEKLTQMTGGGGGEGPQPAPGPRGAVSPEAGANGGAVPMSPAGMRK